MDTQSFGLQKAAAWSAILACVVFYAAFVFAGFIPPPGPSMTRDQVVAMYSERTNGIRWGMLCMLVSSMLLSPITAAISVQIRQMEFRGSRILTYTQLSSGTVTVLTLLFPAIFFEVTAFRPDRNPDVTYALNDLSWFMTVLPWPPFFIQYVCIAIAIFRDTRENPAFPRWIAYFCVWIAISLWPACGLTFFKTGPLAWNGIFSFWIPAGVFAVWFFVMAIALLKTINRQQREFNASNPQAADMADL